MPEVAIPAGAPKRTFMDRALGTIERLGNLLPDPAVLFLIALVLTWVASAIFAQVEFSVLDPRSGKPLEIQNQLTGPSMAGFLAGMVKTFTDFPPLGVVLVALLGVGVAEHTGFIGAGLKAMLGITPMALLTPMVIGVGILSHTAADAGYVLVIPLGGVIYYTAGRHPLAGIAAAFAGVSGGFGANFIPSGIDPLLQGFTQSAAHIINPERMVNPLCNWWFTAASGVLIVITGWIVTDRIIEPRLKGTPIDGDTAEMPKMESLSRAERKGLIAGGLALLAGAAFLVLVVWPSDSPFRSPKGELSAFSAPLMQSIVPLIFLFFLLPGIVHGIFAGTVRSHRDVVSGMSKSMSAMGYYLVLAFFAALFTKAFTQSNLGALVALQGAAGLQALAVPPQITIIGIILLAGTVNLLIGSASAKWALLGPIFVPMLMQLGLSPELTQAAYRVGDSTTNIITPLMPYFPLVVVYCQRYFKGTGIGTLVALMVPYTVSFLCVWIVFLLGYWMLGIPLGVQSTYVYP